MKKQFLNLGIALNKAEQKQIIGKGGIRCHMDLDCSHMPTSTCNNGYCD